MSEDRKAKQDAQYADEPWAKLATEAGFRPWDTESSARDAFRYCAENMVQRDLADALADALRETNQILSQCLFGTIRVNGQYLDREEVVARNATALAAWEGRK